LPCFCFASLFLGFRGDRRRPREAIEQV
jgi:hypothetical protein